VEPDAKIGSIREGRMKGENKIIEALNKALTIELTAINQYFVQAKMLKNWGYLALAKKMYEESIGEMKHADKIIERILFLEGVPNIARYDVIRVGTTVPDQLANDLKLETNGVKTYNDTIELCMKHKDSGTRELLAGILVSSEDHVDWIETQIGLIKSLGLQNYLAEQMGGETK
jgi:bacterioferritin